MSHGLRFLYIALTRPLGEATLAEHGMYNGSVANREFIGACEGRRKWAFREKVREMRAHLLV